MWILMNLIYIVCTSALLELSQCWQGLEILPCWILLFPFIPLSFLEISQVFARKFDGSKWGRLYDMIPVKRIQIFTWGHTWESLVAMRLDRPVFTVFTSKQMPTSPNIPLLFALIFSRSEYQVMNNFHPSSLKVKGPDPSLLRLTITWSTTPVSAVRHIMELSCQLVLTAFLDFLGSRGSFQK